MERSPLQRPVEIIHSPPLVLLPTSKCMRTRLDQICLSIFVFLLLPFLFWFNFGVTIWLLLWELDCVLIICLRLEIFLESKSEKKKTRKGVYEKKNQYCRWNRGLERLLNQCFVVFCVWLFCWRCPLSYFRWLH